MAASVTISGTAIASGARGGRGSLVRTGVETGRSARLSPADLQINGLFGPKIESSTNRSFPISPRPGAESVKLIKIPSVPEPASNVIQFPVFEVPKTRPIEKASTNPSRGEIIFFPGARPAEKSIRVAKAAHNEPVKIRRGIEVGHNHPSVAEQAQTFKSLEFQSALARLRADLALARAMKVRSRLALVPDAQTELQATPILEKSEALIQKSETRVSEQPVSKSRSIANQVRTSNRKTEIAIHTKPEDEVNKRYIGPDDLTNQERRKVLKGVLLRIKAENPGEGVNGKRLVEAAPILAEYLRSKLLFQLGLEKQRDGSQDGLADSIGRIDNVAEADIDRETDSNSALVRTKRPRRLAAQPELIKVFSPKDKVGAYVPVQIIEEEKVEKNTSSSSIGESAKANKGDQISDVKGPQILPIEASAWIRPETVIASLSLIQPELDTEAHNITDMEAYKRKELINNLDLAA